MDTAKLIKELGFTKDQREALVKFAIALANEESKPEWLPTKNATTELGGISADMLENRAESGEFQYGVHYMNAIDSIKGEKGYYLWHIEAIKELWKIPPEQRSRTQNMARSRGRVLKVA